MSQFELKGLDELRKKLEFLRGDNAMKAMRSATGAGAKVIRKAVIANVQAINDPATPDDIGKNIVQRPTPKRYAKNGDIKVRVGVMGGAKTTKGAAAEIASGKNALPGGDTRHFRLVEFGTSKVAARPFMRPAMSQGQAAFDAFSSQLDKQLNKILKPK